MKITDFDITVKSLKPFTYECLLKNKETHLTYGTVVQGNNTPPNEWVYDQFLQRGKEFFIDVSGEIILPEEPKPLIIDVPIVELPTPQPIVEEIQPTPPIDIPKTNESDTSV